LLSKTLDHERAVGRYVEVLCLDHYLEVLKAKPGGLPGVTALAQAKTRGVFTASIKEIGMQLELSGGSVREPLRLG
jgi:hypothetical protein